MRVLHRDMEHGGQWNNKARPLFKHAHVSVSMAPVTQKLVTQTLASRRIRKKEKCRGVVLAHKIFAHRTFAHKKCGRRNPATAFDFSVSSIVNRLV